MNKALGTDPVKILKLQYKVKTIDNLASQTKKVLSHRVMLVSVCVDEL